MVCCRCPPPVAGWPAGHCRQRPVGSSQSIAPVGALQSTNPAINFATLMSIPFLGSTDIICGVVQTRVALYARHRHVCVDWHRSDSRFSMRMQFQHPLYMAMRERLPIPLQSTSSRLAQKPAIAPLVLIPTSQPELPFKFSVMPRAAVLIFTHEFLIILQLLGITFKG